MPRGLERLDARLGSKPSTTLMYSSGSLTLLALRTCANGQHRPLCNSFTPRRSVILAVTGEAGNLTNNTGSNKSFRKIIVRLYCRGPEFSV
jgi:hypothetical protein